MIDFINSLDTFFIVSQIAAIIGIISFVLSFQRKKRQHVLYFILFAAFFQGLHFFFLGEMVATFLLATAVVRILVACFTTNIYVLYVFIFINILVFLYFYAGVIDFLPLVIMLLSTIGTFQKTDKRLRKFFMGGGFIGIVYNLLILSPMGVAFSLTSLVSNIAGYWRYYFKK